MTKVDLERAIRLGWTVRSQAWRVDELLRRLAKLEPETGTLIAEEWDEAFPYQGNESQELALLNV